MFYITGLNVNNDIIFAFVEFHSIADCVRVFSIDEYTKHRCPRSICRYRLRLIATASLSECRTIENHWFVAVQQVHNIRDREWVILCRRRRRRR